MSRKNNSPEIKFLKDHSGNKTGEAFVYFENPEETKKALEKNRDRIGKRWVCGLWDQLVLTKYFYILKKQIPNHPWTHKKAYKSL
jgi:RNA recognition motif-containing protein